MDFLDLYGVDYCLCRRPFPAWSASIRAIVLFVQAVFVIDLTYD